MPQADHRRRKSRRHSAAAGPDANVADPAVLTACSRMNQGAFLMRGLDNVRGEFSLTALAYNLRRALNIVGVGAMIATVRG
jgi:hypothetical protein